MGLVNGQLVRLISSARARVSVDLKTFLSWPMATQSANIKSCPFNGPLEIELFFSTSLSLPRRAPTSRGEAVRSAQSKFDDD